MSLPFAENISYFKTSTSGVESWLDKTERLIEGGGGKVTSRLNGRTGESEGIMLAFTIQGDNFKLIYPVLPTKSSKDRTAAQRQCATLIYHDVKERLNRIKIFGARTVFFEFLLLPNGRTAAEHGSGDLQQIVKMLPA